MIIILERKRNRLAGEKSPYLRQHAENPVDWRPWSDEAFERATDEGRPVFLSIGYSTCHWCHVMAEESFMDEEVADLLNKHFVCIKVDREERPDIDQVYMTVCQAIGGQCGWPLTIVMTPDGKPFFAASYLPKHSRFGQTGLLELLPRIGELWKEKRTEILDSASQITAALQDPDRIQRPALMNPAKFPDAVFKDLMLRYDREYGGFGNAPKFPSPHVPVFLFRYWYLTGTGAAHEAAATTLRAMKAGGIHDQVGGGFHRYSVDRYWSVPHFEKMLYDQALLALAYLEGYQATINPELLVIARGVIDFSLSNLEAEEGGFYSAMDADSGGKEGKYYLWTGKELETVLGKEDAERFFERYRIVGVMDRSGETPGSVIVAGDGEALPEMLQRLLAHRMMREPPGTDRKILTDWNGMMIAALARASRACAEPRYLGAAENAARFILETLRTADGRLLHRYADGDVAVPGTLDDHAFLILGLIELYQASFEERYLHEAENLASAMIQYFEDANGGGFFYTPEDGEALILRRKEGSDGAYPSGNSTAALCLFRLFRLTGRTEFAEAAARAIDAFAGAMAASPSAYASFATAMMETRDRSSEVVVTGTRGDAETESLIAALAAEYLPFNLVRFIAAGTAPDEFPAAGGKATAYLCRGGSCELPVHTADELLALLTKTA